MGNRISATNRPGPVPMRWPGSGGRVRPRVWGAIATVLLVAGMVAGCGGGAHAASKTSLQSRLLAYSNCMRSHGVSDFPDPSSQGGLQIIPSGPGSDLMPYSPAFRSGLKACGPIPPDVTPAQEHQEYRKELTAAKCMRANGVPSYPDPKLINGTILNSAANTNPSSPAFQRAAKKCASGVPLAPPPSSTSG